MNKNIRAQMDHLLLERSRVESLILEIRESCPHNDVNKIARSNTGNYDPSADCYWYDCKCRDCGKNWMEDQ